MTSRFKSAKLFLINLPCYGSNTSLYVGHFSRRTRSLDLDHIFSRYGRVRDVDMKQDYAFVVPRGPGGVRENAGSGPDPGSGHCFNCGIEGHWARDCKAGDWKNTCYRCGERGHIERNCQNSPKKLSRGERYSRSPVRSRSRRGRNCSFIRKGYAICC